MLATSSFSSITRVESNETFWCVLFLRSSFSVCYFLRTIRSSLRFLVQFSLVPTLIRNLKSFYLFCLHNPILKRLFIFNLSDNLIIRFTFCSHTSQTCRIKFKMLCDSIPTLLFLSWSRCGALLRSMHIQEYPSYRLSRRRQNKLNFCFALMHTSTRLCTHPRTPLRSHSAAIYNFATKWGSDTKPQP